MVVASMVEFLCVRPCVTGTLTFNTHNILNVKAIYSTWEIKQANMAESASAYGE